MLSEIAGTTGTGDVVGPTCSATGNGEFVVRVVVAAQLDRTVDTTPFLFSVDAVEVRRSEVPASVRDSRSPCLTVGATTRAALFNQRTFGRVGKPLGVRSVTLAFPFKIGNNDIHPATQIDLLADLVVGAIRITTRYLAEILPFMLVHGCAYGETCYPIFTPIGRASARGATTATSRAVVLDDSSTESHTALTGARPSRPSTTRP